MTLIWHPNVIIAERLYYFGNPLFTVYYNFMETEIQNIFYGKKEEPMSIST